MIAALSTITLSLVVLLGLGMWVGLALMATGLISLSLFRDMPVLKLLAFDMWNGLNAPELVALPMFILMGEILFHSRLSDNLFTGLAPFMRRIPGKLLHTNIVGCTLFAAVSGSSAATAATVGRITLGELEKRGYDRDLAIGSLAGAGTLGFLIPPSLILILYGVLADVSILELFIAGLIPGLILAASYSIYVMIRASANPSAVPQDDDVQGRKRDALKLILPVVGLIAIIIASMYMGIASPSEAAIIGVAGALITARLQGGFGVKDLSAALMGAVRTISMIGLIITGALFLSRAMAFLGLPADIANAISALELSPFMLIICLLLFYIVLGMVLDGLSAIIMTLPVVLPLVTGAGYDAIWFGVFLVIAVEMAQITPPVGFNLFVVKNLTGEPIGRITKAALPFFLIMAAFVVLIALKPEIVTALPSAL